MSRCLAFTLLLAGIGGSIASGALAQIRIPDPFHPNPKKHIPATTPIRKMEAYCITYTDMKGPKDDAGKARVRYKTRHLRAGIDGAKTYAKTIYGSKNVRSVDRGGCKGVYARKAAEEAAAKAR